MKELDSRFLTDKIYDKTLQVVDLKCARLHMW